MVTLALPSPLATVLVFYSKSDYNEARTILLIDVALSAITTAVLMYIDKGGYDACYHRLALAYRHNLLFMGIDPLGLLDGKASSWQGFRYPRLWQPQNWSHQCTAHSWHRTSHSRFIYRSLQRSRADSPRTFRSA